MGGVQPQKKIDEKGREHLQGWILWMRLLLSRHVLRYGFRIVGDEGGLRPASVGIEEALRLLGPQNDLSFSEPPRPENWPGLQKINELLHLQQGVIERTLAEAHDPGALPVEALRTRLNLSTRAWKVLLALSLPAMALDLSRVVKLIQADLTLSHVQTGFLVELLSDTEKDASLWSQELSPSSPLLRRGFIEVVQDGAWAEQQLKPSDSIISFLQNGSEELPEELSSFASFEKSPREPESLTLTDKTRKGLLKAMRTLARRSPARLVLEGSRGTGRRTSLSSYLATAHQNLLTIEARSLLESPEKLPKRLKAILCEASLSQSAVLVRWDGLEDLPKETTARFAAILRDFPGLVAFTIAPEETSYRQIVPDFVRVEFETPGEDLQKECWEKRLVQERHPDPRNTARELVCRLNALPGKVHECVSHLKRQPGGLPKSSEVCWKALMEVAHSRRVDTLRTLAEPMKTALSWEDVVLEDELQTRLRELIEQAMFRSTVLGKWGLGRRLSYGRGLACLFYGPPGTGKTMTATLVAKELSRPLYRVDMSNLVSKWVGETEKNLSKLFDAAERSQAILLFDEADGLFAKRTSVKSSNDRFANMEVNYLLQRMEQYEGITILTTNMERDLDDALMRRLRFRLHFPSPDQEGRARLWEMMIPEEMPVDEDIDYQKLAKTFEIAGGHILNAVLRAAYKAAASGKGLSQDLLVWAATQEARELGMLVRG